MTVVECPQCGNETLRIINVMATTGMIHRGCSNCCYRDRIRYEGDFTVGEPIVEHKMKWKREAVDVTPTIKEPKTILVPGQVTLNV